MCQILQNLNVKIREKCKKGNCKKYFFSAWKIIKFDVQNSDREKTRGMEKRLLAKML